MIAVRRSEAFLDIFKGTMSRDFRPMVFFIKQLGP
jgi:hypothetical protein